MDLDENWSCRHGAIRRTWLCYSHAFGRKSVLQGWSSPAPLAWTSTSTHRRWSSLSLRAPSRVRVLHGGERRRALSLRDGTHVGAPQRPRSVRGRRPRPETTAAPTGVPRPGAALQAQGRVGEKTEATRPGRGAAESVGDPPRDRRAARRADRLAAGRDAQAPSSASCSRGGNRIVPSHPPRSRVLARPPLADRPAILLFSRRARVDPTSMARHPARP